MKRAYLADAHFDERSALRLMLQDLKMQVVGEAADWPTVLAQAPATRPDLVVVDWDLVADEFGQLCPNCARPAPLQWLLSSSAIWNHATRQPSQPGRIHLSAKAKPPNGLLNACETW